MPLNTGLCKWNVLSLSAAAQANTDNMTDGADKSSQYSLILLKTFNMICTWCIFNSGDYWRLGTHQILPNYKTICEIKHRRAERSKVRWFLSKPILQDETFCVGSFLVVDKKLPTLLSDSPFITSQPSST